MLIEGNLNQRRGSVAYKGVALLIVGVFEKLLAQVVAKGILEMLES